VDDEVVRAAREFLEAEREAREKGRRSKGPRSRIVDAIFVMLLARPMRAAEIGSVLGLEARYVSSYLSYWKARGYVDYESGYWYLTPLGEEYARNVLEREVNEQFNEFVAIAQRIAGTVNVNPAKIGKRGGRRQPQASPLLPFTAAKTGLSGSKRQERALAAECALDTLSGELSDDEVEVLGALLNHYARWGTTYMYIDQLQSALEADSTWLMKVLRDLQTKGVVYLYKDPRLGIRVGIAKRTREALEECRSSPAASP
jgi:predicted transcriptional regulator